MSVPSVYQINLQQQFGGGEVYTRFFTLALIELGYKVVLFVSRKAGYWNALLPSGAEIIRVDDADELLRLLPFMALGCTLGVVFLLQLKSDLLMLLMGLFITAYALYSLALKVRPASLAGWWAAPMGTVGGLFGALFGSGGFLYALYLSARLPDKAQVRATQSALISCSTLVRLTLFLVAGVYADRQLLLMAACLLPVMVIGLWAGRRLAHRLSREVFVRLVTWLVLASGLALIARYVSA